jgi:RHS repeat-associated protein
MSAPSSIVRLARGLIVGLAAVMPAVAFAQAAPSAYTSATRYDLAHRVTGTIAPDPDGAGPLHYAAVRNTYDAAGRLTRVEKGELVSWQSETIAPASWSGFTVFSQVDTVYDVMDRKIQDIASAGGTIYSVTQYSYDSMGRLQCTAERMNPAAYSNLPTSACTPGTEGSGAGDYGPDRITQNSYDYDGHLLSVQKAVGTPLVQTYAAYTYDGSGKQLTVTDANGNEAGYTYDGFERLAQWNFPDKTTTHTISPTDYEAYTYDADDNRLSLRKRDGQTISYTYDALNRMTIKTVPAGGQANVYYGYDAWGRQLYARYGSATGTGISNTYDGFGRLISTASNMDGTTRTLGYQYDADNNRTRVTYPDSNYWTYVYDGLDRVQAINEINGSVTTQVAAFAYDPMERRLSDARGAVTQTYGYDGASRLNSLSHDLAGTADDVSWTLGYNPADQIINTARSNDLYAYAYTATSKAYMVNGLNQYTTAGGATLAYDANGNITSDGTTTYGYDVENRLITASNGTTLDYDPMGRLWRVTSPTTLTTFIYDGDALVEERNGSGTLLRRYVHGNGEDDPLLWYEGAGLTDRRGMTVDHQGSIAAIANSAGTLIQIDSYDEYGVPGVSNIGRFQYTGQAWIPELGIYYYKARMYSSRLGRFLQTDPVGYKDQVNLYEYVGDDPVDNDDPSGEDFKSVISEFEDAVEQAADTTAEIAKTGGEAAETSIAGPLIALGLLVTPAPAGDPHEVSYMRALNRQAEEAAKRNKQQRNAGRNARQKSKTQRGNRNVRTSDGGTKADQKADGNRRRGNQDKVLKPPKAPKPTPTPTPTPKPPKSDD